jgi:hypothetical protein
VLNGTPCSGITGTPYSGRGGTACSGLPNHYIPKFLIKGFTNSEGLLYVYDIGKDEIKKNPQSPKSSFFEFDRNSFKLSEEQNVSIIEDEIYQRIDNESSKVIRILQNEETNKIIFDSQLLGEIQFFIISLFWRIPATDYGFDDLIKRSEINSIGIDPEVLRNDEMFQKFQRSKIYQHTINEILNQKPPSKSFYLKISEFEEDSFILGDNPILFKTVPQKFYEIGYMDYLFPPSAKRIISRNLEPFGVFTTEIANTYNMFIISQSSRYVCSGNLKLLQRTVEEYRRLKESIIFIPYNKFVFDFNKEENSEMFSRYKEIYKYN